MSAIKCVVVGAGGHAAVVASALIEIGVVVVGFLENDPARQSFSYRDLRVLGTDDEMIALARDREVHFICGIGGVGDNTPRRSAYLRALLAGLPPLTVIHPAASVAADAVVGAGSFIGPGAILCAASRIGADVIVNTGAIIEHHSVVDDHVHVATGAILCGTVRVGEGAHIGAGAVIRQGLRIGQGGVVGGGAIVLADVADGETVVGNPARPMGASGHSGDQRV